MRGVQVAGTDEQLRSTLAAMAPGTPLRDGLERVLRGNTGALIVLGYPIICEVATGGRSPGKAALGLRVVTVEGAPIGPRHWPRRAR